MDAERGTTDGSEGDASLRVVAPAAARCIEDHHEERSIRMIQDVICGYVRSEGDDLTMRQIAVLVQLARSPLDVTPLAQSLGLSLSTVSRSVDALAKLKYAKRKRMGRKVTVSLTPTGFAKVGRLMAHVTPNEDPKS